MKSLSIVALSVLALAASRTAEAQVFPAPGAARNACACPSEGPDVACPTGTCPEVDVVRQIVSYEGGQFDLRPGVTDDRCDYFFNGASRECHIDLRGWLYYEKNTGIVNAPLIVYLHGHEKERGQPCAITRFFVKRGYVVFAPLRRGHTSPSASSTGTHIDDYVDQCTSCTEAERQAREVAYQKSQVIDVQSAITYMKRYPHVPAPGAPPSPRVLNLIDPDRIAIMGHSFGGSLAVFANAVELGHKATVAISPAALSWPLPGVKGNPEWEPNLKEAVDNGRHPIYFLQPRNEIPPGSSVEPTRILSGRAILRGRMQAGIFPKTCVEPGKLDPDTGDEIPEGKQAHGNFVGKDSMLANWGPSVHQFLRLYVK